MSSKIDPQKYEFFTEKQTTEKSENFIIVTKTFIYKLKSENNDGFETPKNSLTESETSADNEPPSKKRCKTSAGTVCDAASEVSSFDLEKFINKNADISNQNPQDTPKVQPRNRLFKIPKIPAKIDQKENTTLRAKSTENTKPVQRKLIKINKLSKEVRDLEEGQKWHNKFAIDGTPSRGLRLKKRHLQQKIRDMKKSK